MSDTKVCKTCKIPKERTEFYSHYDTKDKLRPYCKACVNQRAKDWQKKNPEKMNEYAHSEKKKEYMRKWYEKWYSNPENKEKRLKQDRVRYSNPDYKEKVRAYRIARTKRLRDNKERVADYLIQKYGSVSCMDCGSVFPWCAMDFDHRPGEVKEIKIGAHSARKANPTLVAKIEKEIAKCDLICSNCHRIRTYITRKK